MKSDLKNALKQIVANDDMEKMEAVEVAVVDQSQNGEQQEGEVVQRPRGNEGCSTTNELIP
jgi:hypothetical protein